MRIWFYLLKSFNILVKDGNNAGSPLGSGNCSKLLRAGTGKRNPLSFKLTNKFPSDWRYKKLLAVDDSIERIVMIDYFDKVANAFGKEEFLGVTIAPISLKFVDFR